MPATYEGQGLPDDYVQWMRLVDKEVADITQGFTQDDFPDWLSRDAFDDGMTPQEAARECLSGDYVGREFLRYYNMRD